MTASLVRLRVYAFLRTGRAVGPLVLAVAAIGILYGGGAVQCSPARSTACPRTSSCRSLPGRPSFSWTRSRMWPGASRFPRSDADAKSWLEYSASTTVALSMIALIVVLPWAFGGIAPPRPHSTGPSLATGFTLGIWAHLVAIPPAPALALGALSSRVATRTFGFGAVALVGGWLLTVVLGLPRSPVPWLAPPMMAVTRAAHGQLHGAVMIGPSAWALAWTAVAGAEYAVLRRRRA